MGYPNVIESINGTQIKIFKPKNHEMDNVNRKGFHSINVQEIINKLSVYTHQESFRNDNHELIIFDKMIISKKIFGTTQ
ncbi:hypothetical protein KUTeg_019804 [Tegillarca granosa]|uniref:Uncharacterized protein n=1 Tax=Tegillarca granosa TaxID=220873 RepID=A0ABQ9EDM3_TEGGR|nr:hypothetical protein KUTeg_019804 [Tegillarca granosa]